MFDEEIRQEIIRDIKPCFEEFKTPINENVLSNMLRVYEQFIEYPAEHEDFAGYHRVQKIISAYYQNGSVDDLLDEALAKFLNFALTPKQFATLVKYCFNVSLLSATL